MFSIKQTRGNRAFIKCEIDILQRVHHRVPVIQRLL
ncbi:Uncharacterised protein [Vibrio cholerae]|nr:Uncharacterised protein [Vibrio cholerae]